MIEAVHALGRYPARALEQHGGVLGGRRVVLVDERDWERAAPDVEAVLVLDPPAIDWALAGRLRLVQAMSVGTDKLLPLRGLADVAVVANARGLTAEPMAEFAVAGLLMFAKDLPAAKAQQDCQVWRWTDPWLLGARRVAVLGAGPVGLGVVERLAALGVECIVACRRPRPLPGAAQTVDLVELDEVLPRVDGVVLALPLSDATRHVVDERRLALLPDHAVVVNVARGGLVDEEALQRTLRAGRLRGALLDVTEREPPPAESGLWTCPRLHLTAHISWNRPDLLLRCVELLAENVGRLEAGEPVRNRVDLALGYVVD